MTQTKAVFVQTFLLGAIFSAVPAVSALAASSADPAGWGMKGSAGSPMAGQFRGDGEKPPVPTVDDCVERTGKTEAECQEMVDHFQQGERPASQGENGQRKGSPDGQRSNVSERPSLGKFFDALQNRIEKTISFLQSKEVDTNAIESAFTTLKEKIGVVKTAHETYQDALATWKSDQTDDNKEALDTARTAAQVAAQAVKMYYHESMLPLLKAALQSIE